MLNPEAPPFEYHSLCFNGYRFFSYLPPPQLHPQSLFTGFPFLQLRYRSLYKADCFGCIPPPPPPPPPLPQHLLISPLDTYNLSVQSNGEEIVEFDGGKPDSNLVPMIDIAVEEDKSRRPEFRNKGRKGGRLIQRSLPVHARGKRVSVWRPKAKAGEDMGALPSFFEFNYSEAENRSKTTLMVQNIPNKYSRKMLLELLDRHCIEENEKVGQLGPDEPLSEYDFVYLPVDFRNKCNLGYAFVNFTTAKAASRLYRSMHKYKWEVFDSRKICEITYARIQGSSALREHFRESFFRCDTDEYLPILLSPPRNGSSCCSIPTVVGRRKDLSQVETKELAV